MDIKQLKHFIEAYRLQSFSEAAKHCIISPQGLHVSINRLEEEVGSCLLVRNNNQLVLTEAGEYLLPKAQEIVRLSTEITEHFAHAAEKEEHLSILFVRGTVELFALSSIAQFMESNPDADIQFRVESDYDCIRAVLNGEADMAVCAGPIQAKNLAKKHLLTRQNMLVVSKDHPLAEKTSISIEDLKDLRLMLPRESVSIHNTVLKLCKEAGFEPRYVESDEPRTAFNCAEIGLGAGIVNEISSEKLSKEVEHVAAIPFEDRRMDWEVFLIKKNDSKQTQLAKAYEACLLQTTKKTFNLR